MEKRSVSLAGHRTSVALEPEFWSALERMAARRGLSVPRLIEEMDRNSRRGNLASTIRVAILVDLDPVP